MTANRRLEKLEAQFTALVGMVIETMSTAPVAMVLAFSRALLSGVSALSSENYTRLQSAKRELEEVL